MEILREKKLAGHHLTMSLAQNRTDELWKNFLPKRKLINNLLNQDLISMQQYPPSFFENFDPGREFEKWAAVEVSDFGNLPAPMEPFILQGGLYALFNYKGSSNDPIIFQFIFQSWLPGSEYVLDDRPHFEVLGAKYQNNNPDSEEEIWIPVKRKTEVGNTNA